MNAAIAQALMENRPLCLLGDSRQQWKTFKAAERHMWRTA